MADTRTDWEYCQAILPGVSRTFALNIVQLEGNIHKAILLGYLFFRIADTFEDDALQNEAQKIEALHSYAGVFRGNQTLRERLEIYQSLEFSWLAASPAKELVENGDRVIRCYFQLPDAYREIIDPHIARTSEGMAKFQERKLQSAGVFQLQDLAEMEDYCYQVAGIVGEMLTRLFCLEEKVSPFKSELEKYQTRFGLALQVTNIVKNYPEDIARGWCYVPASITGKYAFHPEREASLPVIPKEFLDELTPTILSYFDSTLKYIKSIPESEKPIRMFCLIAFVLAYNTLLHLIRTRNAKLSQDQVATLLARCASFAGSNDLLEKDYREVYRQLRASLPPNTYE
ncbi:MAG: squalene/phytoene synthase family protein [Dehalococcoidales bacterium]|nr:squalene/phytoene synthase family protein [Dehalococcoidales bacterium]